MKTLSFSPIPGDLQWKNDPAHWKVGPDNSLNITAGAKTDWFIEPSGSGSVSTNAPVALFRPPVENFLLSAKVTVNFASTFDAGVLFLHERDDVWAKLCFEYSPEHKPMVVSVVTRGVSDDCNSTVIDGNTVYLRVMLWPSRCITRSMASTGIWCGTFRWAKWKACGPALRRSRPPAKVATSSSRRSPTGPAS